MADRSGGREREVGGVARAGQTDDRERASRGQELTHPLKRRGRVHVVQRGDRSDVVEEPGSNG